MGKVIGVIASYAPSLSVVGRDISYALMSVGHPTLFHDYILAPHKAQRMFNKAIIVITFDPLYITSWALMQRDFIKAGIPSIIYTTTEGLPKEHLLRPWIRRDCSFVANSQFTYNMLLNVNVNVKGYIPHGVNITQVKTLIPDTQENQRMLKEQLNAQVIFGTVASGHQRKALPLLSEAIKLVNQEINDAGFVIFTDNRGKPHFEGLKNTLVQTQFGKLPRSDILTLIGSFTYYIQATYTEGFGLPVIEAQAFGVPVIYSNYRPLREIVHPEHSFPVNIIEKGYADFGDGILYLIRKYKPSDLAEQIIKAYQLYIDERDEYEVKRKEIMNFTEQYDIKKLYPKLLEYIGE